MENTSQLRKQYKVEEEDKPKREDIIDDKKAVVLSTGVKEKAPFEKVLPSEWMKREKISVD